MGILAVCKMICNVLSYTSRQGMTVGFGEQRDVAQFGSASGLGPEGRRFESCHPDHFSGPCMGV